MKGGSSEPDESRNGDVELRAFWDQFRWNGPDESRHGDGFGARVYVLDEPDGSRHGDGVCISEDIGGLVL